MLEWEHVPLENTGINVLTVVKLWTKLRWRETMCPHFCALLQEAQQTSGAVERRFSILKRILRDHRNFDVGNVRYYALQNFNSTA